MKIDWQLPAHRKGVKGQLDKLIGPGATRAEKQIQSYVPLFGTGVLALYAFYAELGWSIGQYVVALILTIDILGGIITNATSSAKRWYHKEGEGFAQHMRFICIHFIQLLLFSYFFLDFNLVWVLLTGGYLILASIMILLTPLYLQRPVALIFYALSLILSLYVFESTEGLQWFLPLFYLKLLISHLLKEEPYRPVQERV